MLLSGHHANCCHISPWINKIVIIKWVWANWKKLGLHAIFSCLVKYALWLTAVVCSLLDLSVKVLAVLHLSFTPLYSSSSYLGFTSFFLCCPSNFSVVHRSDCKWLHALLLWDIVEDRNVNDLKKWSFILQYLMSWPKMSQFLAATSSNL